MHSDKGPVNLAMSVSQKLYNQNLVKRMKPFLFLKDILFFSMKCSLQLKYVSTKLTSPLQHVTFY